MHKYQFSLAVSRIDFFPYSKPAFKVNIEGVSIIMLNIFVYPVKSLLFRSIERYSNSNLIYHSIIAYLSKFRLTKNRKRQNEIMFQINVDDFFSHFFVVPVQSLRVCTFDSFS